VDYYLVVDCYLKEVTHEKQENSFDSRGNCWNWLGLGAGFFAERARGQKRTAEY
jgi:hypothetical protein